MSKKSILIVALVAIISGGLASLFTVKLSENSAKTSTTVISVSDDSGVKSHFVNAQSSSQSTFPDLTYAAEKTVPVVVGVENVVISKPRSYSNQYYGGGIDPFLELFGFRVPQQQQRQQGRSYSEQESTPREQQQSGGSGVIVSEDGYIVTNNHVVEGADKLYITLSDGKRHKARLIGTDPTTDIALIKVDETSLPFITFGNSEKLRLGEWLVAVGNPYGLSSTVTAGIVSAKGRNLDVIPNEFRIESFIQTDAAVNPGNSGGALVNTAGELVGINTVIKSPTGSFTGYSFAVPSSIVKKVIVDLMEYGIVQRGMLGIQYQEINEQFIQNFAKELGVTEEKGLYVAEIPEGSAAGDAGVEKGDVVIAYNDIEVGSSSALQEQIAKNRPGDKIKISVKRDGKVKHFDVVLRNKAGEEKLLDKNSTDIATFLGGKFKNLDRATLKDLDIDSGVQVTDIGSGLLARVGVKKGYIITHINGRKIESVDDLNQFTNKIEIIDGLYPNGRYISYSIYNESRE
ncbi:MAG: trypsin-like peptidase domain-containing protein [Rikenellaceae bacterium]